MHYKQDDHIQALRYIPLLVPIDPPLAIVTRRMSSFKQVIQYKHRHNEDITVFVSRFKSLAASHLLHVGVSTTTQFGTILAPTLLNNAMLSVWTPTDANLEIGALAESRKCHKVEDQVATSSDVHGKTLETLTKLSEHTTNDDAVPQPSDNDYILLRKA